MKFRLGIRSKSKKVLATSIEEQKNFNGHDAPKETDHNIKATGLSASKDEIFVDSQAWLDSDCEDDFFSVNGDFTPSRGSTPNHQVSNSRKPQWEKYFSPVTLANDESEPSPTDGKRRLFDLLQDNESEESASKQHVANGKVDNNTELKISEADAETHPKLPNGIPNISGTISSCSNTPSKDLKGTPNKYLKDYKERMSKSKQCCLPSLMPSLSFKEKRKQKMSPAH